MDEIKIKISFRSETILVYIVFWFLLIFFKDVQKIKIKIKTYEHKPANRQKEKEKYNRDRR